MIADIHIILKGSIGVDTSVAITYAGYKSSKGVDWPLVFPDGPTVQVHYEGTAMPTSGIIKSLNDILVADRHKIEAWAADAEIERTADLDAALVQLFDAVVNYSAHLRKFGKLPTTHKSDIQAFGLTINSWWSDYSNSEQN